MTSFVTLLLLLLLRELLNQITKIELPQEEAEMILGKFCLIEQARVELEKLGP